MNTAVWAERLPTARARLAALVYPMRLPLAAVAAGLVVIGCNLAWSTFFFGYPGKVSLSGFPGGHRLYELILIVGLVLVLVPIPGRRKATLVATSGVLTIAVLNLVLIAKDGGGLGAVAAGAWLTVTGGVLAVLVAAALPEDQKAGSWRAINPLFEVGLIALVVGAALLAVVEGFAVEASQQFVSYCLFVAFLSFALAALGFWKTIRDYTDRWQRVSLLFMLVAAVAFPFTQGGNATWIRVAAFVGVFAAAAIGLNVVVGLAGLLDLGYVAFFGIGAYVSALLSNAVFTTVHVHLAFPIVLVLGALVAAFFGVVIGLPTLRLRGDYLAIVTLAFGEIFRIVANNFDTVTRGPNGISGIPDLKIGGFDFGETHTVFGIDLPGFSNYYFVDILLLVLVITAFRNMEHSRIGRAWVAIREDETAAQAMGINTTRLKLLAFAMGAFLAGAAGSVNAHVQTQVDPSSYEFLVSALLLSALVLGGMGTVPGALIGSTLLIVLPEKLRSFQDYRLWLFGIALVLMMRFRPEGMWASRRRKLEFHEPDSGADAMSQPEQTAPVGAS